VRKIEFLEVVIGSDEIKIEEVKIKAVLDWLVSKLVKDTQKFSWGWLIITSDL